MSKDQSSRDKEVLEAVKLKGDELIEKFRPHIFGKYSFTQLNNAKACAIILCDEMIKELESLHNPEYCTFREFEDMKMDGYDLLEFYRSVKQYIQSK